MRAVSAPTVVILAAGEGTRMRSKLPKVLHPLCGRPLILWPVAAALEAGAGKVVVIDNPKRRLEDYLPAGVELAVQEKPNGTGGAVAAAADAHRRGRHRRDPLRRRAADHRGGDRQRSSRPTRTAKPRARWPRWSPRIPASTGASCRDNEGNVDRVVEAKGGAGDATPEQLAIREVNTGIYAFDGAGLLDALQQLDSDNAQGELYLPDVLPEAQAGGQDDRRPPDHRPHAHARGQRPQRAGQGPQARPAADPRAPRRQRRHDPRPRLARTSTST